MPYDLMSFFYSPQVEAQKAQMGKMQVQEAQMQLEDQKRLRDARQSMDLSELSNYVDESSTPELKAALTDFAIAQKSGVPSAIKDAETQVANIRQKTAMSQKEGIDAQMKQLDFVGRQISYFKENPSPDSLNTVVYNLKKVSPQQAQQTEQALAKMGIQRNPITNSYDNIPPQSMGLLKQYVDAQERLGLSAKEKFDQQYKMLDLQERTNQRKEDRAARVEHWKATEQQRTGLGKSSAQERTIANTMTTAASEAGIGLENLSQFTDKGSIHTTTGAYSNLSDHGVLGATAKQIATSLTPQDKQMYESIMLPLIRQAVTIQSGGRYKITEGAVKQEMAAVMASAGQSHMTMLEKMAELKQTIIKGEEAALASGALNDKQQKIVEDSIEAHNKAIPWSVEDVVGFYRSGGQAKDFGAYLKKKGKAESSTPITIHSEDEADSLPNGSIVILNGKKFRVQH